MFFGADHRLNMGGAYASLFEMQGKGDPLRGETGLSKQSCGHSRCNTTFFKSSEQCAFVRECDSNQKKGLLIPNCKQLCTACNELKRCSPLSARQSSRWEKRFGGRFLSREPLPHGALCSSRSTRAAADSRVA